MVRAVKQQNVPISMSRGELLAAEVDHTIERLQEAEYVSRSVTASLEELYRVAAQQADR